MRNATRTLQHTHTHTICETNMFDGTSGLAGARMDNRGPPFSMQQSPKQMPTMLSALPKWATTPRHTRGLTRHGCRESSRLSVSQMSHTCGARRCPDRPEAAWPLALVAQRSETNPSSSQTGGLSHHHGDKKETVTLPDTPSPWRVWLPVGCKLLQVCSHLDCHDGHLFR